MRYNKQRVLLEGVALHGLPEFWKTASIGLDADSAAWSYRFDRVHASRARKWITLALHNSDPIPGEEPSADIIEGWSSGTLLSDLLERPIDQIAAEGRAQYLCCSHRISIEQARDYSGGHGSAGGARKAANNVVESIRRALHFLAALTTSNYGFDFEMRDFWPEPLPSRHPQYGRGMRLYRQIVRWHRAQGIGNPVDATPASFFKASRPVFAKTSNLQIYGPWNTILNQMKAASADGVLPGVTEAHLADLHPVYSKNAKPVAIAISEAEAIRNWPMHFVARDGDPEHIDMASGLAGFFSKELGPNRTNGACGKRCPRANLNGPKGLSNRLSSLRRYLGWWLRRQMEEGDHLVLPLTEYFTPERLTQWFQCMVNSTDVLTIHHTHEYFHATYTARLYFGHDVTEFVEWVNEEFDLAKTGESDRGRRAVEMARSPTVYLAWADAFDQYAANVKPLSISRNSGHYLTRKALQVHLLIRCETGLRPENVSPIRYADREPAFLLTATLFPNPAGPGYLISVPKDEMKQHKRHARANKTSRSAKRPYRFQIVRADSIQAIDEYLASWKHARAVVERRTDRLFLNSMGEEFTNSGDKDISGSYNQLRGRVIMFYKKRTGITLPALDLYSHRHVIGEFLSRHMPGGNLKTWYLTHSTGTGSDKEYGNHDAAFLRQCISEVLDGVPPLHEQERQRLAEAELRERERAEREQRLIQAQERTAAELAKLRVQIEAKDKEIDQFRAREIHR